MTLLLTGESADWFRAARTSVCVTALEIRLKGNVTLTQAQPTVSRGGAYREPPQAVKSKTPQRLGRR